SMRRMVLAAGAAASLLAAAEPAMARQKGPQGVIAGKIRTTDWNTRVTATTADGKSYSARVKPDGRYRLKKIPAGTYTLTFVPGCGNSWMIDKIVVADGEVAVPEATDPNGCIIVGMLLAANARG
ncbi:MAG TPA: carboxypeptidase-like regulatory domain-containing protein, partial [Sphingomonas sp.]